jgi:hypothetical protein
MGTLRAEKHKDVEIGVARNFIGLSFLKPARGSRDVASISEIEMLQQ